MESLSTQEKALFEAEVKFNMEFSFLSKEEAEELAMGKVKQTRKLRNLRSISKY